MLTRMLETAIEIEGLLRIIRDGNPLPETYILLNAKSSALAELAGNLEGQPKTPEPTPAPVDFVMEPAATAVQTSEVLFTEDLHLPQEETVYIQAPEPVRNPEPSAAITEDDLDLTEEDDILLNFEDMAETTITESTENLPSEIRIEIGEAEKALVMNMEEKRETPADDQKETSPTPPPTPFPAAATDTAPETAPSSAVTDASPETTPTAAPSTTPTAEPETTPTAAPEVSPATAVTASAASAPTATSVAAAGTKRQTKLKAAFSLNDRFLYSRELFEGNMRMFDSTLEFIEGIEDYSIIEDYFYSELEWNPEDIHVAAFMDILRPHFKEI